ncbi:hypothetical protein BJ322DRAFT_250404 [Thelephora terrestris]|uniref:Zn(2)-C6 fungal-type domain-containing protein n=1 Tax=Thelephora terrestris TaxID=56493 RepID=A0A9P6L4K5_9AGAM|nr:hypothetical protein BJ322DRAFT_250404 [Thelephora terrestris]
MDDQGAGGSSRDKGTNPEGRHIRESSLPATLRQHLYNGPKYTSSPSIAPLMVPNWPNQPTRSRSQDHGRSLPSPSHLLRQTESAFDPDPIILSRSLGRQTTSLTPQPPQPPLRRTGPSPGIQDVFMEDVGVLPQPEVPVRPPHDPFAELSHSPGFAHEQRRGRTEVRGTHTSRGQRTQVQAQDHLMDLEQGRAGRPLRDPQRQVEPFPSQLIRDRRPPTTYPTNPFEEPLRLQLPPSHSQRQQVHHQPQPRQPARFSQLLSGPGCHGGAGTSSGSRSASTSQSQTNPGSAGELYSEGEPEIKSMNQESSMAEHSAIETQGTVPERKKAQRSPSIKREPGTPTEEGGSTTTSTGATTSARRKASTKVTVACDFCRGRKLRCNGERPCSNCSGRGTECTYQPGGPRRRGPGKAPKKTRAASRQRQHPQQQQQAQQHPPDHSRMSIGAGSPVSSGPSPITMAPTSGLFGGGSPLTPGGRVTTGPRFPSQSPGASTSEMETGSQAGSRRRLSGSSVDEPERKRSRIREFEDEERH